MVNVDIKRDLAKYRPILLLTEGETRNEADTVKRITKFFEDVLSYDPFSELTGEARIKDKYVDLAVKLDDEMKLLIEIKSTEKKLKESHIRQAESYGAHRGVPWVLLTNGIEWRLYRLEFGAGIKEHLVFAANIETEPIEEVAELLGLLHRKSLKSGELEKYWHVRAALSPRSIASAVFTEDVLYQLRREIRRQHGILLDEDDLVSGIRDMFAEEYRHQLGEIRVRRRRKALPGREGEKVDQSAPEGTPIAPELTHPVPSREGSRTS